MAQPVWNPPVWDRDEPDEDDSGVVMLQRVVERPDGSLELLESPLTLEDYLDPQIGDKLTQGRRHANVCHDLYYLLIHHFQDDPDVIVLQDVKVLLGPGLPGPSPDVAVIRGARHNDPDLESFSVVRQGTLPSLVIEVVSPRDARVRRMDEVNKLDLYQRVGIPEYLIVDPPRRATAQRFRIRGYRLGSDRRYQAIDPDGEGRILSGTTGLRFGVSADGQRIEVFVAGTGERVLTSVEETEARKAAEAELARLRAEVERLRKS